MKILLLSDTHGHLDDVILKHCREADEIWHAGDFGSTRVSDLLSSIKPLRGVYGNIDNQELRQMHPAEAAFTCCGLKILMIHIGGYPGAWPAKVETSIRMHQPDIFICGHSHILKITRDPNHNKMVCINPGAAGKSGFHQFRTMVRMELSEGKIVNLEVIEIGKRSN